MAKGRALAQLIMHMSHLTPVGWGYLHVLLFYQGYAILQVKK